MITVFGSIIADYIFSVDHLVRPGETLIAESLSVKPGGKGANQAMAAAKAGAKVQLFGRVGNDGGADVALAGHRALGVDLTGVKTVDAPTGMASICVDQAGENAITLVLGANETVTADQVPDTALDTGCLLLLQMEVPVGETEKLIHRAKEGGAKVVMNLAPARPISANALKAVDILIANEGELEVLSDILTGGTGSIDEMMQGVAEASGATVIATLGAQGVRAIQDQETFSVPALPVDAIDTVGAGDAFAGTFAAAIDAGEDFDQALRHGVAAGSLACTKPGAQEALPDLKEIKTALNHSIGET